MTIPGVHPRHHLLHIIEVLPVMETAAFRGHLLLPSPDLPAMAEAVAQSPVQAEAMAEAAACHALPAVAAVAVSTEGKLFNTEVDFMCDFVVFIGQSTS